MGKKAEIHKRIDLLTLILSETGTKPRAELSQILDENPSTSYVWLVLTILNAGYPTGAEVREATNMLLLLGGADFLSQTISKLKGVQPVTFEVVENAVVVDVMHTANTELATGIQRVVRETVSRWSAQHELILATWTLDRRSLRRLTASEEETALRGAEPPGLIPRSESGKILVPLGGRYIMPELGAEPWRTARISALAEYTDVSCGIIGHDCVPLTTAETTGVGMPAGFARYLSAVSRMQRISVTSVASEAEFSGWKKMLHGIGFDGPDLMLQPLACEIQLPSQADVESFTSNIRTTSLPLVVVVGSHEPRKNHLAVLRAVEKCWNEGARFEMLFIGGNSWNSDRFDSRVKELRNQGIPVQTASAVSDADLYSAYTVASFSIYPSINEGFGLPVAESLMLGTPVITSNFGSMANIGHGFGAELVDPRNSDQIAQAMMKLLEDSSTYQKRIAETKKFRSKTWDDYAAETWDYLSA
jgi:hypothetical protein